MASPSSSLALPHALASGIVLRRGAAPVASFVRGTAGGAGAGARRKSLAFCASSSNGTAVSDLSSDSEKKGPVVMEIPLDRIRRPLMRTRANDPAKVQELMDSIRVIGLQVPIDVLEVDGVYYGTLFWMPPLRGTPAPRSTNHPLQSPSRNKRNAEASYAMKWTLLWSDG
ncbi:hypothetical protein ACP4OV_006601 [Aristida adscensionis]